MKLIYYLTAFFSFASFSFGQTLEKDNSADQAKLKNLPVLWEHYWNIHDMDSMGTMLHTNVDFVNVAAVWLKGRSITVAHHKQRHVGIVFKNSVWKTDSVAIKFIKPDMAVIHLSWGLSGDNDPDGTPRKPRHGIFTWLVVKENKDWKILIAQNTNKKE
jgi:uncharacterized protein (TIGR02246 family)